MREPRYLRANSVNEAIVALKGADGDGLVVAGGIVVGSLFNQGLASPSVLVDISRIPGLRKISREPDGTLRIGALATHDDILHSATVRTAAPLLVEIASDVACSRLRNRGTLGGNLCTIGGQGDPATGLIALNATIHLRGPAGQRTAKIEDFYKNAFEVDLRPDDILEWITVPLMKARLQYGYCKLGPRNAMDWTQITASVAFDARSGILDDIRIGMNGVANTPNRPRGVEILLKRSKLNAIDWAAVEKILNDEISPQADLVYSEEFKRHLAVVALRRAIQRAAERAPSVGGQA